MKRWYYLTTAFLTCAAGCGPAGSDAPPATTIPSTQSTAKTVTKMPPSNRPEPGLDPAEGMRKLRQRALTAPPTEFGLQPSDEFPKVYGALAEFPMDSGTLTVVALRDGNASLYTTGTFGVVGGFAHEQVRTAALEFVRSAHHHHDAAVATTEFPYPAPGRVRFYLLTFRGVRLIDTDLASLETGTNQYLALFARANDVVTEFRKIATK